METKKVFDSETARKLGESIGINWKTCGFPVDEFRKGLTEELEHGSHDPETNVTNDDPVLTGKIAWAHLKEFPDYYKRLDVMETEARRYHRIMNEPSKRIWR